MGRVSAFLFVFLVFHSLVFGSSTAYMIYRVGDDDGWTDNGNGVDYTKWASEKRFTVGDMLVFAYPISNHTVLQTSDQDAYDSCKVALDNGKLWSTDGSSSVNVLLTNPGQTYFMCTASDGNHCRSGMKFGMNVLPNPGSDGLLAPAGSPVIASPSPIVNPGSGNIPSSSGSIITTPTPEKSEAPQTSLQGTLVVMASIVAGALLSI